MEELGQQSLIEKGKPRSVIVPRGASWWWGVDSSTRGLSISWANGEERGVASNPVPPGYLPIARLSAIYEVAVDLASRLARSYPPGIVGLEQPSGSGQQVNHELEFAVGVASVGVYDGIRRSSGHVPKFELLVASWWKVRACGRGDIRKTKKVPGRAKPVKLDLEEYEVMRWARLNGYTGGSWDEADAMAMAEAMRGEWELAAR
jgi:hypothetical protein